MSITQSTPTPISTPAPPRSNPPLQAPTFVPASCTVTTSLSPCAPSPQFSTKPSSPPPAVPARPFSQEQRLTAAPLPPIPLSVPQPPRTQAYPSSLPPRPSETVIAYSNKAPYKPGYSPLTSASDARISYNATGTISNPLNIRPSRFAPLKAIPIQSQQAPKKPLTIGNGWPHTRQANGHGSTSISPVTSKALPPSTGAHRPLTPESTRSSTTPPGLTNFVAYTSPSPPGFLHRSLKDKPSTDSPSSSGEPNIKHGKNASIRIFTLRSCLFRIHGCSITTHAYDNCKAENFNTVAKTRVACFSHVSQYPPIFQSFQQCNTAVRQQRQETGDVNGV